ncbi:MAG: hypothetical protein E7157_05400 [Lactobacillales bacterium]|nr:hypothetical protein [Lactobacillales bacterium]
MGNKKIFTNEEKQYIIDNWEKETIHSMKKKFNCTWYAVAKVAEENNLPLPTSNEWTEDEINLLKELSETLHYKEIAKAMNKTENAIYLKARRLNITLIQDRRKWTEEEEEQFSELWGNVSVDNICKKLKRTYFSLKVKAIRMNLGPMMENNYEKLTVSDICDALNVSRDRITTWRKYGLKLKPKKLTSKCCYYVISLDDLLLFLEQNQNEWDSRNLEENLLGIEPEWLKEKRKRDLEENPSWYRKWTDEEIKRACHLFERGKSYNEIALTIERSENSVATLLRNLGYSYTMPHFWSEEELSYLIENYQNMTYKEMSNKLGRTEKAIAYKISELGYQKKKTKK